MDYFFTLLKKSLVLTVFLIFGLVATYVPQPYNQPEAAEAAFMTEGTQMINRVLLAASLVKETATAAYSAITSAATNALSYKELVLDGIAWALAKSIVSAMVQSLINWINSGFSGSPAFVTDLKGFLINAGDEAIGTYIEDLGALGSFVCSPFRLDVQVAVALEYNRIRGDGQPAPTCTLTGVMENLEGFISGDFSQGGWDSWFNITSRPQTYTPYGSVVAAQAGARVRLLNAQNEAATILDFGDGFLSGEICEMVHGAATPREECFISTPGKIIEEALSFNLDTGRQTLIAADEIDEIISALLGQLANKALTGAAGLLGLSGGTGHTYSGFDGGSYMDQVGIGGTAGGATVVVVDQSGPAGTALTILPGCVNGGSITNDSDCRSQQDYSTTVNGHPFTVDLRPSQIISVRYPLNPDVNPTSDFTSVIRLQNSVGGNLGRFVKISLSSVPGDMTGNGQEVCTSLSNQNPAIGTGIVPRYCNIDRTQPMYYLNVQRQEECSGDCRVFIEERFGPEDEFTNDFDASSLTAAVATAGATVVVVGQSGVPGDAHTIVPGCVNGGSIANDAECSYQNVYNTTVGGRPFGVKLTPSQIISVRYPLNPGVNPTSDSTGYIRIQNSVGAGIGLNTRVSLSPTPGDMTGNGQRHCTGIGNQNPSISTGLSPRACHIDRTQSMYYFNIQPQQECTGTRCNVWVSEGSSEFIN